MFVADLFAKENQESRTIKKGADFNRTLIETFLEQPEYLVKMEICSRIGHMSKTFETYKLTGSWT